MIDLQDDTKDFHSATGTGPGNGLEEIKLVMIQEHGINRMPRIVRSGAGAIRARDEALLTLLSAHGALSSVNEQELRSSATLSYDY